MAPRRSPGQTGEQVDWFLEGAQPSLLGVPDNAVVAAPQGQLGMGGTYYAANNNHVNTANGFVKQAFVNFKHLGPFGLKVGRFEYFDGAEVKPSDPLLATVVQTRIANRLISNFGFSAVQRAFDGVQFSLNSGQNNWTFLGARPTQGVFQVKGMDELDVDIYSGTYTRLIGTKQNAGVLRVFAMGYVLLEAQFGRYGVRLYELARGMDENPVVPDRPTQSISVEDTFEHDVPLSETEPMIRRLAEKLWFASRKESRIARTVVLKLKTSEFKILTRSHTPSAPPSSSEELTEIAVKLRERVDLGPKKRYRLVGVGLSNFQDEGKAGAQPPLFE
jgi:hypothetical protein